VDETAVTTKTNTDQDHSKEKCDAGLSGDLRRKMILVTMALAVSASQNTIPPFFVRTTGITPLQMD
jgi:hypothetical protein